MQGFDFQWEQTDSNRRPSACKRDLVIMNALHLFVLISIYYYL